ncbi:hypothetical protein H1P_140041 [Hyella patelloides LEGE 07179]|uniref:Uncharacterized protein n=1 Tax=Hyella patelloides LEGE 07179 TaxID=945734 RepID=A0A563VLG6_9CYAN|nr:hypothetical protein H1P_140041 [Hyella patelloides LEGE 07179]
MCRKSNLELLTFSFTLAVSFLALYLDFLNPRYIKTKSLLINFFLVT